jgi:uncharacterized protein YjbI with pentapeptide repeats
MRRYMRWCLAGIWYGSAGSRFTGFPFWHIGPVVGVAVGLVGASLGGAELVGALLGGAELVGASLDGAELVGASLDGVVLV